MSQFLSVLYKKRAKLICIVKIRLRITAGNVNELENITTDVEILT